MVKVNNNFFLCSAACLLGSYTSLQARAKQENKPNILWLTFEDTSWNELGCYGNDQVKTPHINALANDGIKYINAWSSAPQSSPARSSLITGCYATTYGMDLHPRAFDTPADIFFPEYLRKNGYYCTNNSKTHYNTKIDNKLCWDECGIDASYNSIRRKKDQPFFAVYNTVTSHMGRIRTFHLDGRRDYTKSGIYPEKLQLPPYLPDVYPIRSDYAAHLEAIQDVDEWVGLFVDDLKEKKLYENTIIFVFSDHGGCLPRGKGYLYESGLKVPLIIHVPEKWKPLLSTKSGEADSSLVNFIDLGATVLSLAGIKPPKYMQGKPIMGKYASAEKKSIQFAFGTNQLHHYMPVRAATDGRYKYIRSYIPYKQFALRNYYQWGMPSNQAWDKFVLNKCVHNPVWLQPYQHHPAEMLFDLESDPFETKNLSDKPEYQYILLRFREAVSSNLRQTRDLGFFIPLSRKGVNLYDKINKENYPLEELFELVELASMPEKSDIPALTDALKSKDDNIRYWGAVGLAVLAGTRSIECFPQELFALLDDTNPYVSCEAAYAIAYSAEPEKGIKRLLSPVKENERKIGYSLLECLSLDPNMKYLIKKQGGELINQAWTLPDLENEDCGLMVRGILANIGVLSINDIYNKFYEKGLKLNRSRRPIKPLP